MTDGLDDVPLEALNAVPVFPLPGTVLLPRTFISLHVFEPRYREMLEDVIEGHRAMVVAMLDERGMPDIYQRPRIHGVGGLGALRRSARLPDGRYNIVLEGLARVDISQELAPSTAYRRANGRVLCDEWPEDRRTLDRSLASLKALTTRALSQMLTADEDVIENLAQLDDPARLADMVAAAILNDPLERQRVLAECNIEERVQLVAGAIGALLLDNEAAEDGPGRASPGWGIIPGKA